MNKKNITLNSLFNLTFIFVAILLFGFVILGTTIYLTQDKLLKTQSIRYESYLLADELRQSSDDLTRLARTYVVTGEKKYEDIYFEILDIRNGKLNRPENYQRIYWDLYVVNKEKPRKDSEIIKPLKELMKEAGFTKEEFEKLAEAEENSNELVATEVIAMDAKKGRINTNVKKLMEKDEDLDGFAQRIMFDERYHINKKNIMKPLDDFFILLNTRTKENVNKYSKFQNVLLISLSIFLITMTSIISVIFYFIYRRIKIPLKEMPETINEISSGNYSFRLAVHREDELGLLADCFNDFLNKLEEVIVKVKEGGKRILAYSKKLNNDSLDLANKSMEQTSALEETSVTMKQISSIVNYNTQKTLETSEITLNTNEKIKDLANMSKKLKFSMKEINESTEEMEEIIDLIEAIAFQTNILSVNATIEAVKAGEDGKGFEVVANEIRELASRSSEGAKRIKKIVKINNKKINTGNEIVFETINKLEEISLVVESVNTIMKKLTEGAMEQKRGIDDIDIAIIEVESAVNLELAEEVKVLAEGLLTTAKEFLDLVKFFKLDINDIDINSY